MSLLSTKWTELDDSLFFMIKVKREGWQLPEWECVGEVHLRQVYERISPHYVAVAEDAVRREKAVIGQFASLDEAKAAVEALVVLT